MSDDVTPFYTYPDRGDRVTVALIDQHDSGGSWEQQESTALAWIDKVLARGRRQSLLDYGSGLGRLAARYSASFARIQSYEPDADRAHQQRAMLKTHHRIRVVESLPQAGAGHDALVCSHVLQHVPVAAVDSILGDIAGRLRPGGHLVLMTATSGAKNDIFVLGRLAHDGRVVEERVNAELFDIALTSPTTDMLPVRFFAFPSLLTDLAQRRFELVAAFGLHGTAGLVGPVQDPATTFAGCRDVVALLRLA